jgi:hypothetical protein
MNAFRARSQGPVGDHQRKLVPVQQEIQIHDHAPISEDSLANGEDERAAHDGKCQDEGNGPVEPVTAECLFVHGATFSKRVSSSGLTGWPIV